MKHQPKPPPDRIITCGRCGQPAPRAGYMIVETDGQMVRTPDLCYICMHLLTLILAENRKGEITLVVEGSEH